MCVMSELTKGKSLGRCGLSNVMMTSMPWPTQELECVKLYSSTDPSKFGETLGALGLQL